MHAALAAISALIAAIEPARSMNAPASGLTAILLTQRVFDGPDPPQLHKDFWAGAYAALA